MLELIEFLKSNSIYYETDVSLKELCTFKIGGNAKIVCYPDSTLQVSDLVKYCKNSNLAYISLGRGSNVLFPDDGINTLIIKTDKIDFLSLDNEKLTAGAGVMLAKVSKFSVDSGFKGMEFAYGIPGNIWYFFVTVGLGEIISCGILGILLYNCLKKYEKHIKF